MTQVMIVNRVTNPQLFETASTLQHLVSQGPRHLAYDFAKFLEAGRRYVEVFNEILGQGGGPVDVGMAESLKRITSLAAGRRRSLGPFGAEAFLNRWRAKGILPPEGFEAWDPFGKQNEDRKRTIPCDLTTTGSGDIYRLLLSEKFRSRHDRHLHPADNSEYPWLTPAVVKVFSVEDNLQSNFFEYDSNMRLMSFHASTPFSALLVIAKDYGFVPGTGDPFIVMDDVGSKETLFNRTVYADDLGRILFLASRSLEAVNELHQSGFVHADLKPENFLLIKAENPHGYDIRLIDYDYLGLHPDEETSRFYATHDYGTPGYVPPEIGRGYQPDKRRDVFSIAATIYWMLTGNRALDALFVALRPPGALIKDWCELSETVAGELPPPSRFNRSLSPRIDRVVLRGMSYYREARYADTGEFKKAFDEAAGF